MTTTPLDRLVGPDALSVGIGGPNTFDVVPIDPTGIGPIAITYGRRRAFARVETGTCSFAYYADATAAELPEIGQWVVIRLGSDALSTFALTGDPDVAGTPAWNASYRFTGNVTDARLRPGKGPGGRAIVTVIATGTRRRLANIRVPAGPFASHDDATRALVILNDAYDEATLSGAPGFAWRPLASEDGSVTLRAELVTDSMVSALELLDTVAEDARSVLAETRDGELWYQSSEVRSQSDGTPEMTLDADTVLWPSEWAKNLDGMVNDLTVKYGPDPQAETQVLDGQSVRLYGVQGAEVATLLAAQADADAFAALEVGRRSRPWWEMPALNLELTRGIPAATAGELLQAMRVSALIGIEDFPAAAPITADSLWVEGWTETITRAGWFLDVVVSPFRQTGPPITWAEIDPGIDWDDVPEDRSWLGATTWNGAL